MTQVNQIYKCNVCGNIVDVLHAGVGQLVCCGQNMELLEEKTKDEGNEKHVPVIEKTKSGIKVKVGSVSHPMEENHFIEWISLFINGKVYRKFLKPGDPPEAEFAIKTSSEEKVSAREYCNLHGLWRG
ncbi:desulfoferrodoxin [Patescibacteria group bacterium]